MNRPAALCHFGLLGSALLVLAACDSDDPAPPDNRTGDKAETPQTDGTVLEPVSEQIGTPMAERVATLGFLNKRNGLTRDIKLSPGQSIRIGRAVVRLRACERSAPWELSAEQGAFVQLLVNEKPRENQSEKDWKKVFSGWLFRESPSLNVVEHPIYDVWVKSCAMSFPGEEGLPSEESDVTAPRSASANLANALSNAVNAAEARRAAAAEAAAEAAVDAQTEAAGAQRPRSIPEPESEETVEVPAEAAPASEPLPEPPPEPELPAEADEFFEEGEFVDE